MSNILIIEDDNDIAEIEKDYLKVNGFDVNIERDGLKGLNEALKGNYDLVLLDVMLPSMDGFEVCKKIREKLDLPILMVSAKDEEISKIKSFGFGADDYIEKPFSPNELVMRVKANIAQYNRLKGNRKPSVMEIGDLKVHTDSRRVLVRDKEIELKNKEYELLIFLMMNSDKVFSKEEIYEKIWGFDAFGDLATVTVHINRLREKIEKNPSKPEYITTVWGAGYRFKAI
ncbi:MAG: response regulator transcription factor [Clostridia bacterium]|nr:response regulator transcription factor [Clostridia bacterium]